MRRQKRKPVYYSASSMNDGTVMAAYPIRKIPDRIMKRDGYMLDEDGVELLSNPVDGLIRRLVV